MSSCLQPLLIKTHLNSNPRKKWDKDKLTAADLLLDMQAKEVKQHLWGTEQQNISTCNSFISKQKLEAKEWFSDKTEIIHHQWTYIAKNIKWSSQKDGKWYLRKSVSIQKNKIRGMIVMWVTVKDSHPLLFKSLPMTIDCTN